MIPEGSHKVRAVEAALVQKNSGAHGIDVVLEVDDGEHKGARLRWYGHLINRDGTNSEYAQRVIESLRHLGWRTDDLTDLAGLGESVVVAVVEHETNPTDGKTYANVRWINALSSGPKISDEQRVPQAAAKQLAQRFAALARGVPKGKPAPAHQQRRPQSAPSAQDIGDAFGGDDIPF